ncbi:ATP-binding cassette long-chain fatty acid transporter pxa1 [Marasmius sp. AFHP31]|nr:ATP-binding cassette long-chain fatty acid transporter pxa1 [Marasmius sp. AFHP31]
MQNRHLLTSTPLCYAPTIHIDDHDHDNEVPWTTESTTVRGSASVIDDTFHKNFGRQYSAPLKEAFAMAIFSKFLRFTSPSHGRLRQPRSLQAIISLIAFVVVLLLRTRVVGLPLEALEGTRNLLKSLVTIFTNSNSPNGYNFMKKQLSPVELSMVLQQLYVVSDDEESGKVKEKGDGQGKSRVTEPRKTLLVPYQNRLHHVPIRRTSQELIDKMEKHFASIPESSTYSSAAASTDPSSAKAKKSKALFDPAFTHTLYTLLRIAFPSTLKRPITTEHLLLLTHTGFLILRTYLSVLVARLDGRIVRDLVSANGWGFLQGLGLWFALAVPSTITNVMIKHLQSVLGVRIRGRVGGFLQDLYLARGGSGSSNTKGMRFYTVQGRLEGVDQYLTADVEAWAEGVSGLYGNLMKPTLDMVLFTSQLAKSLGARGTVLLFGTYWCTIRILRAVTPAFGKLASVEARLEGEYRAGMGRLGRESEEVAFYDGGAREKDILTKAYLRLIKHVNNIYKIRIAYEWTEDYVIKYLWSAAGYGLIAVPLLFTRATGPSSELEPVLGLFPSTNFVIAGPKPKIQAAIASRTESYISNRRLLLSLADAGGRLMYAYKDILELAGVTERLGIFGKELYLSGQAPDRPQLEGEDDGDCIILQNVDIGIPGSDTVLVKDLSLRLKPGDHLMITGSNGVGKTAIARVLGGLWDPLDAQIEGDEAADVSEAKIVRGVVKVPGSDRMVFVPQRAYHPQGTLLDQIIYPDTYVEFTERGIPLEPHPPSTVSPVAPMLSSSNPILTESPVSTTAPSTSIRDILESVYLGYLPEREGGWTSARKEWRDVLSGGEKQRVGVGRMVYSLLKNGYKEGQKHRGWAVLDECTSAVSSDVEGRMYEYAKSLGITLITVSLRPSLMKHHKLLLTLNGPGGAEDESGGYTTPNGQEGADGIPGPGGWTFTRLDSSTYQDTQKREEEELEERLREVEGWEKRVKELDALLRAEEG